MKILPAESRAALIDGAEALKQYPYGCLEQTYSSTIPNLFLYKYIASKPEQDESDHKLLAELKKNLETGRNRLLSQYRGKDGGYSMWGSKLLQEEPDQQQVSDLNFSHLDNASSVYHTALILSLLGLVKDVIEVPADAYENTLKFLVGKQNAEHHYDGKKESSEKKCGATQLLLFLRSVFLICVPG